MFNLFEIYRNHIRYKEIERKANDNFYYIIEALQHHADIHRGSEDVIVASHHLGVIKLLEAQLITERLLMGSSVTYPTKWTRRAYDYLKNHSKEEKNAKN
jgi:hypothetical protein